eukprot:1493798-Rhodomonas_salina.1
MSVRRLCSSIHAVQAHKHRDTQTQTQNLSHRQTQTQTDTDTDRQPPVLAQTDTDTDRHRRRRHLYSHRQTQTQTDRHLYSRSGVALRSNTKKSASFPGTHTPRFKYRAYQQTQGSVPSVPRLSANHVHVSVHSYPDGQCNRYGVFKTQLQQE